MKKICVRILSLLIFLFSFFSFSDSVQSPTDMKGKIKIEIFSRENCKNCINLEKFLEKLSLERDDFIVVKYDIEKEKSSKDFFYEITEKGKLSKATPVIYVNESLIQGFQSDDTTGKDIIKLIDSGKNKDNIPELNKFILSYDSKQVRIDYSSSTCLDGEICELPENTNTYLVKIPIINKNIDVAKFSLPVMALVLGTIDGFNPCAMWVLILFLTTLVALGDKKRMFLVAGLFVLAESIMYYLILNVWIFTWDFIGLNEIVTPIIGIIGIIGGILFIRSYIKNKTEIACDLGDMDKKAKISRKIQGLAGSKFTLLTAIGIISLALSVNVIEFACSVGIPQTYTKILELNTVSFISRQIYNFIYIFGYMIDDFIVFGLALFSINKVTSTGKYTRLVNLCGGILMIILGIIMIIKPEILIF